MEHLTVTAAQRCVIEAVGQLGTENVALEQCLGRVLAEDVRANRDQPPYDVSAMDGFALRSADVAKAPATLEIIEDIKAGDMPRKTVQAGQCTRIMTGAPVPPGADAVIRVEDTQSVSDARVQINVPVKPDNDIRPKGEGMRNGEVVLVKGTELTPGAVGMLAMVKRSSVQVYRQPRVAILSTGDELEGLNDPFDANKIPDANSYALMAQVQALGVQPTLLGIARDKPEELRLYLQEGLQFDALLVSGGTSVGVHDYVRPTLEALGVQMRFWRVEMKPGHPMAFGATAESFVFGLPGNPVSSMVCFEQFVLPALRRMMGHASIYRRTVEARLTHEVKHKHSRTEFVRVMLSREEGGYTATSTGAQGSGILASMSKAEGLLVVPPQSKGLAAGSLVTVQLLDGTAYQQEAGGEW
ncbi:molybdopterin molybdotransferase MoeA [Sideroxydans lithotrophicus]|uniref:Molybdopterin molybdenumtransferase n=1 Tax=Sideroxydans lithotrophicus (strain ES-1) TaxID=580332 RepID=D5CNW7_SIDLE|nr:gephyrin-like molybdotransferase Glp [Sideroxydans lithotrophicus]ADE12888.1 molybdenum cofactor synthesis domain protein [Sideroxydans lithotrophicus ES-1]